MFLPLDVSRGLGRNEADEAPDRDEFDWAPGSGYARGKALLDFLAACLLSVAAAPLILLSALLVKLTSRGAAFYSQTRLGRHGRPYRIYKIRTMYQDCERQSGPRWSTAGDSRVTPAGRFLRRTHLDELPQLWNVLKGDMSLVGPRPERPEFVPHLEQALPHYRRRLLARPGVTGLAQLQLPADTDLESVRRKLAYDLYYVGSQSLWLDLRLIAGTAFKVFGVPFPVLRRLFFLPGMRQVEDNYRSLSDQVEVPLRAAAAPLLPGWPERGPIAQPACS